jgi:hypothetical protein
VVSFPRRSAPYVKPATNAAMKPLPPSGAAKPYARAAVPTGTTCNHDASVRSYFRPSRISCAPTAPLTTPNSTPYPIAFTTTTSAPWKLVVSASASLTASAIRSSGTQMPSFNPDSTFNPCRMREGRRASVTTACPSAASVGARMIASSSASPRLSSPKRPAASAQPARIVSGRPIPSSRSGTAYSRRSAPMSIRDASAKSTRVSVTSASSRTASLREPRSIQPRPLLPKSRPSETKKIAAVTGVRSRRRETTA